MPAMLQDLLFAVSKLLGPLLDPRTALYVAFVAGTLGLWTPWRRAARLVLTAAFATGLVLGAAPFGPDLVRGLEERIPPPAEPPARVDGIVVLGGDADNAALLSRPVSPGYSPVRQIAFADLARSWPEAKLVYSGGSGSLDAAAPTDSDGARVLLATLGLDPARVLFEDRSRNTHENAVLARELARPQPGENWLLVTSALHMPRALGSFRKAGWAVVPYPVGYTTLPAFDYGWRLSDTFDGRIGWLANAAREYAGLVYYYLLGRTDALFPAP